MVTGLLIVILLLASIYLTFRVWYLAGALAEAQEYIEELEATNQFMYQRIEQSYSAMKQIDRLGAFEADDEAGTTFQLLNQVIVELKDQFDGSEAQEK